MADVEEVQALSELPVSAREPSGIEERICAKRKQKHQTVLKQFYCDLDHLYEEAEDKAAVNSKELICKLSESLTDIELVLRSLDIETNLREAKLEQLQRIWNSIEEKFEQRKNWIYDFEKTVMEAEREKTEKIRSIFKRTFSAIQEIAYFNPARLYWFMEKEVQSANLHLVKNKRVLADIKLRLLLSDLEFKKQKHAYWSEKLEARMKLKLEQVPDDLRKFMAQDKVANSPDVKKIEETMIAELSLLVDHRSEIIESISNLRPPLARSLEAKELCTALDISLRDIHDTSERYLLRLHKQCEAICQECLIEMDRMWYSLVEENCCTEEEARNIAKEKLIPLIIARQKKFEEYLDSMDKQYDRQYRCAKHRLFLLVKYVHGLAQLWDNHDAALAKLQEDLQKELTEMAQQEDEEHQVNESKLEKHLMILRQATNETKMSSEIKVIEQTFNGFELWYDATLSKRQKLLKRHPVNIKNEVADYEKAISIYFGLRKDSLELTSGLSVLKSKSGTLYDLSSRQVLTDCGATVSDIVAKKTMRAAAVSQSVPVIGTSQFPWEEDLEEALLSVSMLTLSEVKASLRTNFMEHLEGWKTRVVSMAEDFVELMEKDLEKEVTLKKHVLKPRLHRIWVDIYNVRQDELLLHANRLARHMKAVQNKLAETKARLPSAGEKFDSELQELKKLVQEKDAIVKDTSELKVLMNLREEIAKEKEEFFARLKEINAEYRSYIEQFKQDVVDTTNAFIASMTLFDEGGNFNSDEKDVCKTKLDKICDSATSALRKMRKELDAMESSRRNKGRDTVQSLETRLKTVVCDIRFVDEMAKCLSTAQLQIKSKSMECTLEGKKFINVISDFVHRMSSAKDAEAISTDLASVTAACRERFDYLDCRLVSHSELTFDEYKAIFDDYRRLKRSSIVGKTDAQHSQRKGTLAIEDPAIAVIQSILKPEVAQAADKSSSVQEFDRAKILYCIQKSIPDAPADASLTTVKHRDSKTRDIKLGSRRTSSTKTTKPPQMMYEPAPLQIFGEVTESGNRYLLGVRNILRDCLHTALTKSLMYYNSKGLRRVTRPKLISDTFDKCAETLQDKTLVYYNQALEFATKCIEDLHEQLARVEKLCEILAEKVLVAFGEIDDEATDTAYNQAYDMYGQSDAKLEKLQGKLRPALGHPNNEKTLENLCEDWGTNLADLAEALNKCLTKYKEQITLSANSQIQALSASTATLMTAFDEIIASKNIEKSAFLYIPNYAMISQMQIKEKLTSLSPTYEALETHKSTESVTVIDDQRQVWSGLHLLGCDDKDSRLPDAVAVSPLPCHAEVINVRDAVYKNIVTWYSSNIKRHDALKLDVENLISMHKKQWETSVAQIKKLYEP